VIKSLERALSHVHIILQMVYVDIGPIPVDCSKISIIGMYNVYKYLIGLVGCVDITLNNTHT